MRTYALGLVRAWEGGDVGIFHYLELVLLVGVEEAVEGCRGEGEGLGDQGGEGRGEVGHLGDVGFVSGAELGKVRWIRPLIGRK